ncbi:MAG: GTP cyclohydrolase I FolE [Lachnospiraceae bacterium]|nr:GTP cyclohydrolase I FolE [Lachnospiraceae bacterium]
MDKKKIEKGVRMILEGMGEDPEREGLLETPARVARMYEEIFAGYEEDASKHLSKQFTGCNTDLILEKDIPFYSMCEHHMVPFYGKAHIAYVPGKKVAGLSKLARTVEVYAKRLQLQERMTSQIADSIMKDLGAKGVMVVIEAEHMCMTMRGVKKPGSKTETYVRRGVFEDENLTARVLSMIKNA